MSLANILLGILLILWGLTLTGVLAVPGLLLGILAIVTGLVIIFEHYLPTRRTV